MSSTLALIDPKNAPAGGVPQPTAPKPAEGGGTKLFGGDGFTFDDILDVINPLHHLPVIGPLYRSMTGDTISPVSRLTGGALFGGPIGFAASFADTLLREASGKDAGSHVLGMLGLDGPKGSTLQTAKTTDTDKLWEQARLLRHDINDDHDRPGTMNWTPVEVAAANGAGGKWATEASYAISLKHDFYDHEPETSEPAPRDTSLAAARTPAPAAVQARPTKPEASAAPLPPNGPQTAAPTTQSRAGPQASGALPPPHALAANPAMINTLRKGQSAQFRAGATLNSDAWLQLMNGAGIDSGPRGRTTGAAGLATSTVSSALAKYGAAAAKAPPIANR